MKKYALIKVKTGWYSPDSTFGRKMKYLHNIITVKKTNKGLWFNSAKIYIPTEQIEEVLEGDICEYLL